MKALRAATLMLSITSAIAGPASGNIAYKCTVNGKTSYSDAPCIDAKVIDTSPTEGLDSMTGKKRWTPQMISEHTSREIDKALKPITGMNREQAETARRRYYLDPPDKQRCYQLDNEIPQLEKGTDSQRLYRARMEYRNLKC